MLVGDADAASEPPAGGWGHDSQPAFPAEELWTELHPQDEDRPAGTTNIHTDTDWQLFSMCLNPSLTFDLRAVGTPALKRS